MDPRDLLILVTDLRRALEHDHNIPLNDAIRAVADLIDQISDNLRLTPQLANELLLARAKAQVGKPFVSLEKLETLLLARHVWNGANDREDSQN
ncbi:hypothetical protein [Caballeronia sp. LZ035]|uniref:hypothetical protein n=1 Tax=Caballeronia sp. LZ035 TaxID=3038568 RepID=UPI002863D471|nr:hypothetical protein [Caballeronia sp. LZ035]MDR5763228.1 hypothetical protein [Caballeronia sp. LZ035]